MPALNNAQLEILKLFRRDMNEQELFEIKKVLSDYLFDKAIRLADEAFEEKGYTVEDVDKWKNEHSRLKSSLNESSN